MKLKNKLVISFLCIITIPLFLFTLFGCILIGYQVVMIRNSYGIDAQVSDMLPGNNRMLERLMSSVQDQLEEELVQDPQLLEDPKRLEVYLTESADSFINVVVYRGNELYYQRRPIGTETEQVLSGETNVILSEDPLFFYGDDMILGRDLGITFADGSPCQVFTLVKHNEWLPEIRHLLMQFIGTMIFILFLTACIFTIWIYRSIVPQIRTLRQATEKIRAGNLEFTIEQGGSDEMGQLCADFEEMRKRLKENTEEKLRYDEQNRELLSNISHDLKTPITSIKGYVEGILDGIADTPDKMERYLKTIYNKTNDMQRLIDELTFYSKIDTNRIPYNFAKLSAADFFAGFAEELSLDLSAAGVAFSYSNEVEEKVTVIADPEQIHRVMNNIVSNSCKYFDKTEKFIHMRVKDAGDFIQLEFEDNGKGIAAKDIGYIFDRFYRTDSSRNSAKGGSGIGLSIVKKIMEDHGGRAWAGSKEGQGTTIYLVLRKYQEPVSEHENEDGQPEGSRKGIRIPGRGAIQRMDHKTDHKGDHKTEQTAKEKSEKVRFESRSSGKNGEEKG